MKALTIPLLSIILLFAYCSNPSKQSISVTDTTKKIIDTNRIIDVSLINLITNPKEYEGYKVRVQGYLNLQYHTYGLYLHKEDYEHAIYENAIGLSAQEYESFKEVMKCNNHYVLIEGTFSKMQGGTGIHNGSIENIGRIEIWENMGIPPKPSKHQIKFPPPGK
jgi:hypothetical protein